MDEQGSDFPNAEAALDHARQSARFTMSEHIKEQGRISLQHRIDVEDENGVPIASVRFADVVEIQS